MEKEKKIEIPEVQDEEMTVTLDLDDDTSVTCAIVTILTVAQKDYIVLLPLEEDGENRLLTHLTNIWIPWNSMSSSMRKTDPFQKAGGLSVPFPGAIQIQKVSGSCDGDIQEPSFFLYGGRGPGVFSRYHALV